MMRVLLISSSYPPVLGGLQTVTHQLAKGLIREEHDVQVVTNHYPRSLSQKEILEKVLVRRYLFLKPSLGFLRERRPDLFLASFWYYPVTMLKLNRLVRWFQPQVVNLHYPLSQISFVLALKARYRFRLVVSLHGDEILPSIREGRDNQPLRSILRQADSVTACSNWLLSQAADWEPSIQTKGVAIHNGITPERFKEQRSYSHARPYILAYGRLSYQKGFDLLLEAFSKSITQFPGLDLILAGDGEEEDSLKAQSQRLGLDERVHFFGRAAPHEVVQLLNGCSLLVVPSRWEPFGIVALEGMAAAKPILATEVGGVPELLAQADTHARLVPPTKAGLTGGLLKMLEEIHVNSTTVQGERTILSDFSWEQTVAQYQDTFRDCG